MSKLKAQKTIRMEDRLTYALTQLGTKQSLKVENAMYDALEDWETLRYHTAWDLKNEIKRR